MPHTVDSYDCVETAGGHDLCEFFLPIEDIDAEPFFFIEDTREPAFVKVWADEGVAAFDVASEVGQDPFMEKDALP